MDSSVSDRIAAVLSDRAGTGSASAQISEAVADVFRGVEAALTPVIGPRGVAALYRRSLHVTARSHPWLAAASDGYDTGIDVARLQALLEQQTGAQAAAVGGELLNTFHELLASLIGASLTERMLRAVWAPFLDTATPSNELP